MRTHRFDDTPELVKWARFNLLKGVSDVDEQGCNVDCPLCCRDRYCRLRKVAREGSGFQRVQTCDQVAGEGHSHDGWWCDEHGVPEGVCTQCNASLVADFKAKGDWCESTTARTRSASFAIRNAKPSLRHNMKRNTVGNRRSQKRIRPPPNPKAAFGRKQKAGY